MNGNGGSGDCPVPGCTYRLRVTPGDDGRALTICDGGHQAEDVVGPLRLAMRDLFAPNGHERGGGGTYTPRTPLQQRNTPA